LAALFGRVIKLFLDCCDAEESQALWRPPECDPGVGASGQRSLDGEPAIMLLVMLEDAWSEEG
jgi:hypothetical protein